MTIDTSWLSSFKEDIPSAFTQYSPINGVQTIFSDGQIRLMQSPPQQSQTWDEYIRKRFLFWYGSLIKDHPNARTLVIAFDNYEKVPSAKSMTQTNRRKHVQPLPFSSSSPLPCMVPEGETWMQAMCNRAFKNKVIDMLTLRLPGLLCFAHKHVEVIIDYTVPVKYKWDEKVGDVVSQELTDMPALGEADVKFTRWCEKYDRVVVDSIDGDCIPIALLHHERMLQQDEEQTRRIPRVAVYRMCLATEASKEAKKMADASAKTKRKKDEEGKDVVKEKKHNPREYEYVYIHALYVGVINMIRQSIMSLRIISHQRHEMHMLVALIALTGTDFSRHLPLVSGRFVFENLGQLWVPLCMAYDCSKRLMKTEVALHNVVSKIYALKFCKHLGGAESTPRCDSVLGKIKDSKLSVRTKGNIPSMERLHTTILNCNWVLQYWQCDPETCPDALGAEDYGYVQEGGKVNYKDMSVEA